MREMEMSNTPSTKTFVIALAVLMVFLSACGSTATTPVGGGAGRIAFSSFREGESMILIMNADGSEPNALTDISVRAKQPVWSPDGDRIAFVLSREEEGHNLDIYLMDEDGSNLVRLTDFDSIEVGPTWSPDGTKIAFTSSQDTYTDMTQGLVSIFNIFVMSSDGSGVERLTDTEAKNLSPDWSPDGKNLVFQTDRDGDLEIYLMNADGSGQVNLTNDPSDDQSPSWSPNGKMIAFASDRDGNEEIYLMNADGSNVTRLTDDPGRNKRPAWSPDGRMIAFYSDRSGNFEVYVMATDGSGVTKLTDDPDFDGFPSWQP
jgi:Tol biopolymer transport system component